MINNHGLEFNVHTNSYAFTTSIFSPLFRIQGSGPIDAALDFPKYGPPAGYVSSMSHHQSVFEAPFRGAHLFRGVPLCRSYRHAMFDTHVLSCLYAQDRSTLKRNQRFQILPQETPRRSFSVGTHVAGNTYPQRENVACSANRSGKVGYLSLWVGL